jgi:hypothetical protein
MSSKENKENTISIVFNVVILFIITVINIKQLVYYATASNMCKCARSKLTTTIIVLLSLGIFGSVLYFKLLTTNKIKPIQITYLMIIIQLYLLAIAITSTVWIHKNLGSNNCICAHDRSLKERFIRFRHRNEIIYTILGVKFFIDFMMI